MNSRYMIEDPHYVQQTYQSGVVDGHNEVKERFETCSMTGRILLHLQNTENTPFHIQIEWTD